MPIVASDIQFRLSVLSGSQGNSVAGTPAGSLGAWVSTTVLTDATLNNLFDDVSGAENAALEAEYRCLFVYNSHATLEYQNVFLWIDSQVTGGADVAIGVDPTAASAVNATVQQALSVANEDTAPAGVGFSTTAVTRGTGLSLGTIPASGVKAFWVRRTTTNSAPLSNDGAVLAVSGDTAA